MCIHDPILDKVFVGEAVGHLAGPRNSFASAESFNSESVSINGHTSFHSGHVSAAEDVNGDGRRISKASGERTDSLDDGREVLTKKAVQAMSDGNGIASVKTSTNGQVNVETNNIGKGLGPNPIPAVQDIVDELKR